MGPYLTRFHPPGQIEFPPCGQIQEARRGELRCEASALPGFQELRPGIELPGIDFYVIIIPEAEAEPGQFPVAARDVGQFALDRDHRMAIDIQVFDGKLPDIKSIDVNIPAKPVIEGDAGGRHRHHTLRQGERHKQRRHGEHQQAQPGSRLDLTLPALRGEGLAGLARGQHQLMDVRTRFPAFWFRPDVIQAALGPLMAAG